jgi:hypothetical protein
MFFSSARHVSPDAARTLAKSSADLDQIIRVHVRSYLLALLIVTNGGWRLAKTVTAFTASHSLTSTAASLGWVHVPSRPVEAVIALSSR